jgi:hypothetical protein
MDQLHEQEFTSLLVNVLSNVVRTHLRSYATTHALLLTHLDTHSFLLPSAHLLITLRIHLALLTHPQAP